MLDEMVFGFNSAVCVRFCYC